MAVTLRAIKAKLPIRWAVEGEKVLNSKNEETTVGKGGQVISAETEIMVPFVDSVETALVHFGGEKDFLTFVNESLEETTKRREYQGRLAAVKPSDLSLSDRIDRAVAAMVKTGLSAWTRRAWSSKSVQRKASCRRSFIL